MKASPIAQFDLSAGSLSHSPCKNCDRQNDLPDCIAECKEIEAVQQRLSCVISCSLSPSDHETYTLVLPGMPLAD